MQRLVKQATILVVLAAVISLVDIVRGQETTSRTPKHIRNYVERGQHHRRHHANRTNFGDKLELDNKDKYATGTTNSTESEDDYYEDEDYEDDTQDEENKFIDSGDGIISDHTDFVLLRLNHISMKTSSNISEILSVQQEEFKVNSLYKSGWSTATKLFDETMKEKIFNNTSPNSIVQKVPAEYHIALIAYTLQTPELYGEFNKHTREICSGQDIDKYQWKSYFKLLQLAIETLGTQEERWRDNRRFLYRGASVKYVLNEGQILAFQHFISTSTELTTAENFAGKTLFEFEGMYNGTAMAIWDHSFFEHEKEVLFSPLQVFRVDSVHVGNHYTRYVLVKHEVLLPCDQKRTSGDDQEISEAILNSLRISSGGGLPSNPGFLVVFNFAWITLIHGKMQEWV